MIKTAKHKTKSAPKELPPGWKLDEWARDKVKIGYRAVRVANGKRTLMTLTFPTEAEMIASAHEIEAAERAGLSGLAGKGLVHAGDDGGTPLPTEYSQAEINRMAGHHCADKIAKGEPVKICYVLDQPHVITELKQGEGEKFADWIKVSAYPILPLANATEEGAAKLRELGARYIGKKVNTGSKKNPDWWVIVGPEKTFTVDYPDDEIEAAPDSVAERLRKEAFARWRREPKELPALPKCECGETLAQHDAHAGACGLADCGCEVFAPADLVSGPDSTDAGEPNGHHPQMLRMIPLNQIEPSPTNPRKHCDPVKLQELADSIIEHGLVEPILVRPLRVTINRDIYYELVAGERRWRAAKLAGLTEIEAKVRDLDDKAVLEIQFIENLQRADLSSIEEAQGYKRLLDEHGYTADSLAGKLGKSKSYVYGRLKLCNLPAEALIALAKGDLPATVGELIGRLPSMEMREKFWEDNFFDINSEWFEQPSFRDVKAEIERNYMRELKSAPFSQADKKLLPEAGSCKDCPKRTGNNRGDYPDGRADVCTDVPCYERKVEAHVAREAEKAKAAGAKVLSKSATKHLFNGTGDNWWLSFDATKKYVKLDDKCPEDKEGRGYADLLEGHLKPVVAIDPQGKTHLLAPREEAEQVLKEQYKIKPRSVTTASDSLKASQAKRQEEQKLREASVAEIVTRALDSLNGNPFSEEPFMRLVAKFLMDQGDVDVARAIAKRRGIEYDTYNVRGSVESIAKGLDDADLPGLLVELLLLDELEAWASWGSDYNKFPLCDYFGLKRNVVLKEVSAKLKAEAKEKKKPGAKAKAAARA